MSTMLLHWNPSSGSSLDQFDEPSRRLQNITDITMLESITPITHEPCEPKIERLPYAKTLNQSFEDDCPIGPQGYKTTQTSKLMQLHTEP